MHNSMENDLMKETLKEFELRKSVSFEQLLVIFGPKIGTIIAKLEGMDLIVLDDKPSIWKLK